MTVSLIRMFVHSYSTNKNFKFRKLFIFMMQLINESNDCGII